MCDKRYFCWKISKFTITLSEQSIFCSACYFSQKLIKVIAFFLCFTVSFGKSILATEDFEKIFLTGITGSKMIQVR